VVHAYHYSNSRDQKDKIKDAIYAVGSPIVASALSTMGACVFLFACRTWIFIELGILICSITFMALLYTMLFLFSWLNIAGPRPIDSNDHNHLHRWDFRALFWIPYRKTFTNLHDNNTDAKAVGSTEESLESLNSSDVLSNEPDTGVDEKEDSIEREQDKEEDESAVHDKESEEGK
ncbi:MAG: hypothetical protein ACI8RD_014548, partial [Bacillariaceae sp.]|jgi:hypothetical protein